MLKTVPTTENGLWRTLCASISYIQRQLKQRLITGAAFVFTTNHQRRSFYLKQEKAPPRMAPKRGPDPGRILFMAYLFLCTVLVFSRPAYATTIWTKASEVMKDVYSQILTISTIAAVVTAAVALLMMNFSRSGRTVDESRAWLKRIVITWIILNSLGFIMGYITPFFSGGQWTAP